MPLPQRSCHSATPLSFISRPARPSAARDVHSHVASACAGPQCAVHHQMAMQKPVLREMAARVEAERNQTFSDWCGRLSSPLAAVVSAKRSSFCQQLLVTGHGCFAFC